MKKYSKVLVLTFLAAANSLSPSICRAEANIGSWSFLRGTPAANFTDEDWSIFENSVMSTLNTGQDGASNNWENPNTRASGTVTVLKTLKTADQDCRLVQLTNQANERKRTSKALYCKQPDGEWKVTSPKKILK